MKAKEIIKILNNKEFDKNGKLCFYMKDGDKEIYLDIKSINYFGISSDIPIELTKIDGPPMIESFSLKDVKKDKKKMVNKTMKKIEKEINKKLQ